MAINGNTLAIVEQKLTNITTTEATFREGLDDVAIELSALQEVLFSGQSPNDYSTGVPVSVDAIRGLDSDVVPADLNLLGNISTATGAALGAYDGNPLTRSHFRLLAQLNAGEYQAIADALNGINTVSEELDTLDGVYTENTGDGRAGPKPTTADENAGEGDWLSAEDLNKLVGWSANVATAPNDLNKLTAISANAIEINSLATNLATRLNTAFDPNDVAGGLDPALTAAMRAPGNVDRTGNAQYLPQVTVAEVNQLDGINTDMTIQAQINNKLDLNDTDPGDGIILTEVATGVDSPQITVAINANADFEFDTDTTAGGNGSELALASPATGGTIRGQFSSGTGVNLAADGTLTTVDSQIVHDNLSGYVANDHVDHSAVTLTAGAGLTGGGDITNNRTFDVGEGTGITVAADTISTNDSEIVHDNLSGFVANEHIDHSAVSILTNSGLTGGGDLTANRTVGIATDGVTNVHIASNAVNADSIAADAVGASEIAAGAVGSSEIGDITSAIVTVRAETSGTPSVADFNGAIFLAEY